MAFQIRDGLLYICSRQQLKMALGCVWVVKVGRLIWLFGRHSFVSLLGVTSGSKEHLIGVDRELC